MSSSFDLKCSTCILITLTMTTLPIIKLTYMMAGFNGGVSPYGHSHNPRLLASLKWCVIIAVSETRQASYTQKHHISRMAYGNKKNGIKSSNSEELWRGGRVSRCRASWKSEKDLCLTHFWPMFLFYTPWKHQKTKGFLVFSGGIKWEHWLEMS